MKYQIEISRPGCSPSSRPCRWPLSRPRSHGRQAVHPRPRHVHFGGSTSDLFSPSVPDFLSEKRQRELTEMLAALKRFQPTKIAVESTPEGIGKVNAEYQAYLKGEYQLEADEFDQIAYRSPKSSATNSSTRRTPSSTWTSTASWPPPRRTASRR